MVSNNTKRSQAMHKNIILQFFLFIIDALLINTAFLLSFVVRYGLDIPEINFLPYKNNFPFLTFVYMLALIYSRVFKNRSSSYWHLFKRTFNGLLLGTLFSISLLYVFRIIWSDFPSSIFVISFPIALIFIYLFNSSILRFSGRIKKKVIVIGKQKSNGIIEKKPRIQEKFIDTIEELLHCEDVDEVIICKQIHDTKQLNLLIYLLLRLKVNVVFNPSIYAELISGNVMNDNLLYQARRLEKDDGKDFSTLGLKNRKKDYVFLTLHRPSNVDSKKCFDEIADALNYIATERPILFPVHPRTRKMMDQLDIKLSNNIFLLHPLGFKESLFLWKDSKLVLTDSGGLQEETTALGVPCVTLRENTERPITIEMGTNVLAGTKKESILNAYKESIEKRGKKFKVPPKWDGKAAERIWNTILNNSPQRTQRTQRFDV